MSTLPTFNLVLFVTLVAVMAGLTLLAVHRAGRADNEPSSTSKQWTTYTSMGLILWLGIPFVLAKLGITSNFDAKPSPVIIMLVMGLLTIFLSAVSPVGKRIAKGFSLYALFGFQVYRLAIEILLMLFHKQGLAPIQVTLEGRNWDVVTGLLALGVLVFFRNKPLSRSAYAVLNLIGLGLVLNITIVSVLSLPVPFQVFTESNIWVTQAPYIWLPTFLVQLAVAGHIVSFRKLWLERKTHPAMELAKVQ
jgi:hypothetical protein